MVSFIHPDDEYRFIATDDERFDPWELPFGDPRLEDFEPDPPKEYPGTIPPNLESMPPGPLLAAQLSGIDIEALCGRDRVTILRAHQRMVSHHQAGMYRAMQAIAEALAEARLTNDLLDVSLATEAEVSAALTWGRQKTRNEIAATHEFHDRLPRVLEALEAGDVDLPRARAILHGTSSLDRAAATEAADGALEAATDATVGKLRASLRGVVIEADPDAAERHLEEAIAERRVVMEASPDGSADLMGLDLPPDRAVAIRRRIESIARRARADGDGRTADQVRADVFMDLLLGKAPGRDMQGGGPRRSSHAGGAAAASHTGSSHIEVRVDLTTLMELDERAAEIPGFGPVIGEIARKAALDIDSRWSYTVTDPVTGRPISTGVVRRRPTAAVARSVRARQPECVFPGCRMPAADSDLDHRKPWAAGGRTHEHNLHPLCRHHHRVKSTAGWTYEEGPDGAVLWRSRLGRVYRRRPPP